MKIDKLLAGIFAFIMVTGMIFPAYAQMRDAPLFSSSDQPISITSDDDIIYENGNGPDPSREQGGQFLVDNVIADDFVVPDGEIWEITDAHFVAVLFSDDNGNGFPELNNGVIPPPEPMFYFIFADNNGEPGAEIRSGTAQNLETMLLQEDVMVGEGIGDLFEIWFDFEDGAPLDGGATYWFAMHFTDDFEIISPDPLWLHADVDTGNEPRFANEFPPETWFDNDEQFADPDFWFQLTGDIIIVDELCDFVPTDPRCVVGGEFLTIDSTALILAGAQTNAVWIISALAVIGSVAFGALYITSKRN